MKKKKLKIVLGGINSDQITDAFHMWLLRQLVLLKRISERELRQVDHPTAARWCSVADVVSESRLVSLFW